MTELQRTVTGLAGLGAAGWLLGALAGPQSGFAWQAIAAGTAGVCLAVLVWFLAPTPSSAPGEEAGYARLLERHLCPQCLHPNRPWRSICRRCITPSGGLASLLPFESNLLYGWAFGAAFRLRRPTGLQCLGGMGMYAPELANLGLLCVGWKIWDARGFSWSWQATFGAVFLLAYAIYGVFVVLAFLRLPLRWAATRAEPLPRETGT